MAGVFGTDQDVLRPYDVTILYMDDALEWCEYLFDLFVPYDVHQNSENITDFPDQESTLEAIRSSHIRIAIISPIFLEKCSPSLESLITDKPGVGLLCGVSSQDLSALELRLPSYKNWDLVDAQDEPKILTQKTMKMLDESFNQENLYLEMIGNVKKTEPDEDEEVYVTGTMQPDANLYDITDMYTLLTVVPERISYNNKKKFYIIFPDDTLKLGNAYLVKISGTAGGSHHVEGTALNPYLLTVLPPKDIAPGTVTMEITYEGSVIGTCSAMIVNHLDVVAENLKRCLEPLNVICESLGIAPADVNQLDNLLYEHVRGFQDNTMLKNALTSSQEGKLSKSDKVYPTALHFAASFGLKNITNYLLGLPGADSAGTILNRDNLTPAKMAENKGHFDLSDIMNYLPEPKKKLEGYVKMKPGTDTNSRYARPRPQDVEDYHKIIDEGTSIYDQFYPSESFNPSTSDDDDDNGQTYEPIHTPSLAGPALPGKMNPTLSPTLSPTLPPTTPTPAPAIQVSKKELWEIDQAIKNKEITMEEAHKLFDQWTTKHIELTPPPTKQPLKTAPKRFLARKPKQDILEVKVSDIPLESSSSAKGDAVDASITNQPAVVRSRLTRSKLGPPGTKRRSYLDPDIPPSRAPPPIPSHSHEDSSPPQREPPPPPPVSRRQPAVASRPPTTRMSSMPSGDPPSPPKRPIPAPRN